MKPVLVGYSRLLVPRSLMIVYLHKSYKLIILIVLLISSRD